VCVCVSALLFEFKRSFMREGRERYCVAAEMASSDTSEAKQDTQFQKDIAECPIFRVTGMR
jgi:hypothetical protein